MKRKECKKEGEGGPSPSKMEPANIRLDEMALVIYLSFV